MRIHLQRFALWTSVVIVSVGVISKLPSLFKTRGVHEGVDPILLQPEPRRDAIVALLELCALAWLWHTRSKPVHQGWCIALLGGVFVLYHVALGIANIPGPCPCFGSAWRVLGLSEGLVKVVTATLAWVLFCSGVVLLTWSSLMGEDEPPILKS
jgi:hypothetical protein